ncbi:hypothetical protein BS47DRAFT_626358 [Hydnum rufescens UP504]|uniref:Uncharacterized protein n=1 Tax=Hydnum rufescens UP504 TaxID=1448309 RepID=A0A9P6B3H9_9AGAM|nr:hypothetical protein BS47DRAFT_626358 [Hydnum rufescens UP504]
MISHMDNPRDLDKAYPGRHNISRYQSPGQIEYSSHPYSSNNRFPGRPKTAAEPHPAPVSSSERFMDHNIQSSPTYRNRSYDSIATPDAIPQYSPMASDASLYGGRLDSPLHVTQSTPSPTAIPPTSDAVSAPASSTNFPTPASIWKTGLRQLKEVPLRRFRSSASLFPRTGVLGRRNPLGDATDGSRPTTAQPFLRASEHAPANRDISARSMTADSYSMPSSQRPYAPPPYASSRYSPSRASPGYVGPSDTPHSNHQDSSSHMGLTMPNFPSLGTSYDERSSYSSPKSASGHADYSIPRQVDSGRSSLSSLQADDAPSAIHPRTPQSDMYLVSNLDNGSPSSTNNETHTKVPYQNSAFVAPYSYPGLQHIPAYEGHPVSPRIIPTCSAIYPSSCLLLIYPSHMALSVNTKQRIAQTLVQSLYQTLPNSTSAHSNSLRARPLRSMYRSIIFLFLPCIRITDPSTPDLLDNPTPSLFYPNRFLDSS